MSDDTNGPSNGHDWHEWRGQITQEMKGVRQDVQSIREDIRRIFEVFEQHSRDDNSQFSSAQAERSSIQESSRKEIGEVKTKIARWSGALALLVLLATLAIGVLNYFK